ncbi:efflux RND transporter permease subunit [Bradyrhizobium japonicum]
MVEGYPGLYRDVQTYLKERIREVLTGTGEAIVVRIFGPDLDVLRNKAEEVRAALADVPNLVNLHKELIVEVPHIQVTLKLEEAQRYGLKPGDARRASATLMAGEEVGDIFSKDAPMTFRCGPRRNSVAALTLSAGCRSTRPQASACGWRK